MPAASAASTVAASSSTRSRVSDTTVAGAEFSTTRANGREKSPAARGSISHALAARVDQQPLPVGGRQQHGAVGHTQRERQGARRLRGRAVELDVAFQCQPGEAFAGGQGAQQLGIGDHQRGQRRGGDRPGDQRLRRFLDHRAQVFDAAVRAAEFLRDRDAEDPQLGQPGEHRTPGVGLTLLHVADGRGAARPRRRIAGPVAHQGSRGKLLVGDGRYHLRGPPRP